MREHILNKLNVGLETSNSELAERSEEFFGDSFEIYPLQMTFVRSES